MPKHLLSSILVVVLICFLASIALNFWYNNFSYISKVNLLFGFDIIPDEFVALIRLGSISIQPFFVYEAFRSYRRSDIKGAVAINGISCLYMLPTVFLYFVHITPIESVVLSFVVYFVILAILYYFYRPRFNRFLWLYPILFLLSPKISMCILAILLMIYMVTFRFE